MTPGDYGDPAFDGLLEHLRPSVQDHSGLRLSPTYSYFRMYKRGDVLARHRDRPACEISVTLDIGQKPLDPRPIYVQGEGEPCGAELKPAMGCFTAERSYSIGVTPTRERRWSVPALCRPGWAPCRSKIRWPPVADAAQSRRADSWQSRRRALNAANRAPRAVIFCRATLLPWPRWRQA
jgi:hypothetical protein